MVGAEHEDNSDFTLKDFAPRFDACEWRFEEQFQSLHKVIKSLNLNNNKDRDSGKNNRVDDLSLSRPIQQQDDDLKPYIFHAQCSIHKKVCKLIINNVSHENIFSKVLVSHLKLSTEPH